MNNGRDCPHGRQVGKCDTCDLIKTELELQQVLAAHDAEVAAKAIEDAVQLCNYYSAFPVGNGSIPSYVIKVDDLKQYAAQLREKAGAA